jgi:transcriptional regulator with XRE-family HTH domain
VVVDRAKVEEMEEQGLTLREIAGEVGISAASVSRLLRSRQRIPDAAANLV